MKYASVFITTLIVWSAVVGIAALADDTETTLDLYRLTMVFTMGLFIMGFMRRKG